MNTLYLICGLLGSGKTTLAKKIAEEKKAFHLSEDDFMEILFNTYYGDEKREAVAKLQRNLAQKLLAQGLDVVMDAGFWGIPERDLLSEVAKNAKAKMELHYMNTSFEILEQRIIARNQNLESQYQTPLTEFENWKKSFQVPQKEENAIVHESL